MDGDPRLGGGVAGAEPMLGRRRRRVPVLELKPAEEAGLLPPIRKLTYLIFVQALTHGAEAIRYGDVENAGYRWMYRIAGEWRELIPPPSHIGLAIGQYFRVIAELDAGNLAKRQQGPLRLVIGGGSADLSIAVEPESRNSAVEISIANSTIREDELNPLIHSDITDEGSTFRRI